MKACAARGSSLPPTAPKERNRCATAPFNQYGACGLGGAPELAQTEERTAPRRLDEVEQDLQRGVEGTWTHSRLIVRYRESERHSHGACLRAWYAAFFGKAYHSHEKCSTGGATRHIRSARLSYRRMTHRTAQRKYAGKRPNSRTCLERGEPVRCTSHARISSD